MEPKDIHDLIDILSKSNLSQLEIEDEGFKLKLVKKYGPRQSSAVVAPDAPSVPAAAEVPVPAEPAAAPTPEEQGLFEQKTPFVGTFYQSPTPDADPFVEVGTRVKKGQTLCIVEAMKLMNEIECEQDGEIAAILVENGQTVEYGDPLFHIRPA